MQGTACAANASLSSITSRSAIRYAGAVKQLPRSCDRAQTHDSRIETDSRRSENTSHGSEPKLVRASLLDYEHRGSSVVDTAASARRDATAFAKNRFQASEVGGQGSGARVLVGRHQLRSALGGHRHRDDFSIESPFCYGDPGATLTFRRERVLCLAAYLATLGHVLGGFSHGIGIVPCCQLRIDETPAEQESTSGWSPRANGLSGFSMMYGERVMLSTPPAMKTSPSPAAIACAADAIACKPEPHRLLTVWPGIETGKSCDQCGHARDVAVVLAGLVCAAEDHVVDLRWDPLRFVGRSNPRTSAARSSGRTPPARRHDVRSES